MALAEAVEVCGEVGDARDAIRFAKERQPDVCLVGRDLPGGSVHAVRGICRAAADTAVVVLAQERDGDEMIEFIRAGAIGYVPGAVDATRLLRIVEAVDANEAVVPRSLVLELVLELRGGGAGAELLTPRESQVLRLVRRGNTTAAIADALQIAPVTVRRHISELVHKLGVEHRSMLVADGGRWSTHAT
jgi:DNA-binding NarL/FixJ family response regulator